MCHKLLVIHNACLVFALAFIFKHTLECLNPPKVPIPKCEYGYSTYAWKFDATVTTFWWRTLLLDVEIPKLAAGSLDHADLVRFGVVSGKEMIFSIRREAPSTSTLYCVIVQSK